jgi:hypothetical protein
MTRAKFYVTGLTLLPGQDAGVKVDFSAVSRGDRNAGWAAATPIGSMTMTIQNPIAVQWWEEFMRSARTTGKSPELYVDIAPSEDGWPGDGHAFRLGDFPETHYAHGKCGECGLGKDDDLTEYDQVTRKSTIVGKVHPNG